MKNAGYLNSPPRHPLLRFIGKTIIRSLIGAVVSIVVFVLAHSRDIYYCATLDLKEPYRRLQPVTVTDASKQTRVLYGQPWLKLDEVPEVFLKTLVKVEDQRFYERDGAIDGRALSRAAWATLRGKRQGGSPLEAQTARSAYSLPGGSFDHSLNRKVLEMIIATRLAKNFSKDQVLELYVNSANFAGEVGLRAAARRWFDREPRALTPVQSMWLISTLPAPAARAKKANQPPALDAVKRTAETCIARGCEFADLGLQQNAELRFDENRAPHSDLPLGLKSEIERTFEKGALARVQQLGANVELTLDFTLQSKLQTLLSSEMRHLAPQLLPEAPDDIEAAVVVLDAQTGAILACIGSRNPERPFSCATQAKREMGSPIKPLTMAAAIEAGNKRPQSIMNDAPLDPASMTGIPTKRPWPANADGKYRGWLSLSEALAYSRNPVFVQLGNENREGLDALLKATELGAVEKDAPAQFIVGKGARLVSMAGAYALFANDGVWHKPYFVARVIGADKATAYVAPSEGRRLLRSETVNDMYEAMRGVIQFGTAKALSGLPGAAKTGTTSSDGEGRPRDLRLMYVEHGGKERRAIVVALWVGVEKGAIENRDATSRHVLALGKRLIEATRNATVVAGASRGQ